MIAPTAARGKKSNGPQRNRQDTYRSGGRGNLESRIETDMNWKWNEPYVMNDETDTTMAPPWSMVDSSSDRRHGDMDDGDDDDTYDDTDDDTDDDHDDDTDDDNDHKNDSYTAAGAAPGASIII